MNQNVDDRTLIQKFVQGETELLASQNFRLDSSGGRLQITTHQSEIVAILNSIDKKRLALVKNDSKYTKFVNQILSENNFVFVGESKQKGFVEHHHFVPPDGYKFQYTEIVFLWKSWWIKKRQVTKHEFNLELLFLIKNNWYPVQTIDAYDGVFTIKTLVGQVSLHGNQKVMWANKLSEVKPSNIKPITTSENPESISDVSKEAAKNNIKYNQDNKTFLLDKSNSSLQPEFQPETETATEELIKNLRNRTLKTIANYLDEIAKIQIERISQAEQRAERLAARLEELGVDPDSL